MDIKEFLELNEEQELLLDLETDYVVEAGAGSGKTRVLVSRYLHILKSGLAGVDQIVAITFTENATRELKDRVREFIGAYVEIHGEQNYLNIESSRNLTDAPISTIHGFAARIIAENPYECGLSSNFKILEGIERNTFMDSAINDFLGNEIRIQNNGKNNIIEYILDLECSNYSTVSDKLKQMLELSQRYHLKPTYNPELGIDDNSTVLIEKLKKLISNGPKNSDNKSVDDRLADLMMELNHLDTCRNLRLLSEHLNKIKFILSNSGNGKAGILHLTRVSPEETEFARDCESVVDELLETYDKHMTALYGELFSQYYKFYDSRKKSSGFMEYEDLLTTVKDLFESNLQVLAFYRTKFRYILIDEFQDTDELQYGIINMLSAGNGPNSFIVGDLKQSIFGFRGANPNLMHAMITENKPSVLSFNYRSDERLVCFFNEFFNDFIKIPYTKMKPGRAILSDKPVKEIIYSQSSGTDRLVNEARSVALRVKDLSNNGYRWEDIVIILRSNNTMHYFESALAEMGIEYRSGQSVGYFESQEVRDVVRLFKYIMNPYDNISEACVLRSVFYGASDTELFNCYTGSKSTELTQFIEFIDGIRTEILSLKPLESLKLVLDRTGYMHSLLALKNGLSKYRNIIILTEIFSKMQSGGSSLSEIIDYLDLSCEYNNEYIQGQEAEAVNVVTILNVHRVKGLEFPVVILADLNHGSGADRGDVAYSEQNGIIIRMPGSRSPLWAEAQDEEKTRNRDEERRLLYVAMTRAEQKLILSVTDIARKSTGSFYDLINSVIPISSVTWESESAQFKGYQIPVIKYDVDYEFGPEHIIQAVASTRNINVNAKNEILSGKLLIKSVSETCADIPEFNYGKYSIEAGSIMHRFLQLWNFQKNTIVKYSDYVMNEGCTNSRKLGDLLKTLALNYLESELIELIKSAESIRREIPFYIELEGNLERRVIDLLIFRGSNISIIDYKYSSDIKDEYIEQMQLYEKAVLKHYSVYNTQKRIVHIPEVVMSSID